MRLAIAVSLVLGITAFAEVPFTPPAYGPAAASQMSPSVASDGDDYLVVWMDQRTLPYEAYATRVSRDGVVLDPTGIRIPARDVYFTRVVWTGTSYLVIWDTGGAGRVFATRISREGTIVEAPHVLIEDAQLPSVIRAGEWTVVSYLTSSYPHEGRAVFFDADGNVVSRVTIFPRAGDHGSPRIAWNGSNLVAVWSVGYSPIQIKGIRFDSSGLLDAEPRVLLASGDTVDPKIASDGSDFVLLTTDYMTNVHRTTRVAADLTAGPSTMLPAAINTEARILWTGAHYVVIAENGYSIRALRIDRDAKPMDAEPALIENTPASGSAPAPAIATNGHDLFLAWHASLTAPTNDGVDIYGGLVSTSTFTQRSKSLLSVAAARQSYPAIASNGAGLLTLWNESSGLYARRTNIDGAPIEATPIRLGAASRVAAVFDGSAYVVAVLNFSSEQVTTFRIPASGELRAEEGTSRHLESVNSVALASSDGVTLLAWAARAGIQATRVGADARWIDDVPLTIAEGLVGQVDVAAGGGSGFLVTWGVYAEVCCHGGTVPVAIRGARITRAFANLDHDGFDVAATEALEGDAKSTWNGREWLVVWHRDAVAIDEIRARRVDAGGALPGSTAGDPGILLASGAAMPEVVWDGARYVLAWLDTPSPDVTSRMHVAWFTGDAIRVGATILGDAEAYAISGGVKLQPVAHGRVTAAYARIAREPVYGGVARAFLSTIRTIPARRRAVR